MTWVLKRRWTRDNTETHGEVCVQTDTRLEWCLYKVRSSRGFWKLEETRKDQPLGVSREAWLCQHLDFRLLTSRAVRPRISIALTHCLCHFVMAVLGNQWSLCCPVTCTTWSEICLPLGQIPLYLYFMILVLFFPTSSTCGLDYRKLVQ